MFKSVVYILFIFSLWPDVPCAQNTTGEKQVESYYVNEQSGQFQKVPQTKQGVDSLLAISRANINTDLQKALEAARQALTLAKTIHYKQGIAYGYYLAGANYKRLGNHTRSLKHYLTALDLYDEMGDKNGVGSLYNAMANLYLSRKNYENALKYYKKAIYTFEASGSSRRKASAIMNVGTLFYFQDEYKQSLKYFKRTLKALKNTQKNQFLRMVTFSNMGNSYISLGKFKKAEEYLLRAIDYFESKGLTRNTAESYIYLAKLYKRTGNEKARAYARAGLEKAKNIGHMEYIIEGHRLLAEVYASRDNYRQAYRLYKQYSAIRDSLLSSNMTAKVNNLLNRFKVQKKNQKIELLTKEAALQEAEAQQQRLWKLLMIIGFGLLAIIAGLLYRNNKQKKEANALLEEKNDKISRQNKRLVQLNKEKDEFLGMAAHDLRSPLSGITGAVDLLKADDMDKKELHKFYDIIGVSAGRMLGLIDNLLDVNEAENNLGDLKITEVRVPEVAKDAVGSYEKQAKEKNIELIIRSNHNSALVAADKNALHRILDNLISNAVKYSPPESTVAVASRKQDGQMEISVEDNGPGIHEEEQKKLFKRYTRLSTKPTADETSTGLGLFIVKRLTEKMGGSARCKSQAGRGSEFVIKLPLAKKVNNV